jgi:hypothetical protein
VVLPQACDNMSYGLPRWMSDYSWNKFRQERALWLQTQVEPSRTHGPGEYILLSGIMTPTLGTARLDPFYRLADVPTATLPLTGPYAVELWAEGTLLATYPFTLTPGLHPLEESESCAPFVMLAPYVSGTTHLDLVSGTLTLLTRTVSAHTPAVTITYPPEGETFSETLTLAWAASDADGETLAYAVLYSADDGATWLPLGLDWPTTTLVLSTTLLAGSDQARVQVWATDGVNTGVDVTAAFTVPTREPSLVTIVFPEDGGHYPADRLTLLQGGAGDPEDGALTGASLVWTDSIDGLLGTGEEMWAPLSPGWHAVTLTATDGEGKSASASVTFCLGYPVYLSVVWR